MKSSTVPDQVYAAHILTLIRFKDGVQDLLPLWENVVLLTAPDPDAALLAAERYAQDNYLYDFDITGYTVNDRPAYCEYWGVRKLQKVPLPANAIQESVEITSNELEVADQEALQALRRGETVTVILD